MKKIYATTVALLLFVSASSNAFAQSCPPFPTRGKQIINSFLDQSKYLLMAQGSDDDRRVLTKAIAEQMRFDLGSWSVKSADKNRPQSKDSLALPMSGGPAFCNYDWQNGSTRRAYDVIEGAYIADQNLLPTAAVNHLGGPPQTPVVDPAVPDIAVTDALAARISSLEVILRQVSAQLAGADARLGVLADEVNQAETAANKALDNTNRIDDYLATRPIPTGCTASFFGRGSCGLRFP